MDAGKNLVRYFVSICLGLCLGLLIICAILLVMQNSAINEIRTTLIELKTQLAVARKEFPKNENVLSGIPLPKSNLTPMPVVSSDQVEKKEPQGNNGKFRLLKEESELSVPDTGITLMEEK